VFNFFEKIINYYKTAPKHGKNSKQNRKISKSLNENLIFFKKEFDQSADLAIRELKICNIPAAVITVDGLIDKNMLSNNVLKVIMGEEFRELSEKDPEKTYEYLRDKAIAFPDQIEITTYEDAIILGTSGFALLALEGSTRMLAIGVQGFSFRGIAEPTAEASQRGPREGFVEPIRINITMIRRRMRNAKLKFEMLQSGTTSQTAVALCYITDRVSSEILNEIKNRLNNADLATITTSGCISAYLEEEGDLSLFSSVGLTERPDTVCGKISEGRVAVLIDGSSTVLIVPYLFVENFHTIDDYSSRPYFATLNRILKFLAFFVATLLPGLYVGLGTFNPELFPGELLNKIALSVGATPFSLMLETLTIHFIYEIMREAGLRLPQTLGHAVSIVGGLVIGDAAINSGLIGAPTLMVVALTAICSYVIPTLYEPIAILRFLFIIFGGLFGTWGIMILFSAVLINICSKSNFGIPFLSPISPFGAFGMRDTFIRASWRTLSKGRGNIQTMPGAETD
jgi:spore germination protein KA